MDQEEQVKARKAQQEKQQALGLMGEDVDEEIQSEILFDNESEYGSQSTMGLGVNLDAFEFENLTYNIYEFQYNASLCYIMMNQIPKAQKMLELLLEILPETSYRE